MHAVLVALADGSVIAKRNLIKVKRVPDILVFTVLSPIMFVLLFAYAFSWVMAWVGLLVPTPEVVNNASFMVIFPLTFIANTFVPVANLPTVLRTFAEWNPISTVTQASRDLFGNTNPADPPPDVWPLQNPEVYTLIWVAIILAVFVPLANRQYRKATSR